MPCEKCGGPTKFSVQLIILAPDDMQHNIKKSDFRRADVEIQGANWETMSEFCRNPQCRHVVAPYGNYVTDLKADVETLRGALKKAGADVPSLRIEADRWKKPKLSTLK